MRKIFLLVSVMATLPAIGQQQQTNAENNPLGNIHILNDNLMNNIIQAQVNVAEVQEYNQQVSPGSSSFFGSSENRESDCKDCEAVKKALRDSHAASRGNPHGKIYLRNGWYEKMNGRIHISWRKNFHRSYKAKTSYALCYNWH